MPGCMGIVKNEDWTCGLVDSWTRGLVGPWTRGLIFSEFLWVAAHARLTTML